MNTIIKESIHDTCLNQTRTVVKVGKFTVQVIESHSTGLVTTRLLAGKGSGWASAHYLATNAVTKGKS